MAECRIGMGTALMVADADLLNDALWLGDPDRPLDQREWTADNPALLIQRLNGPMPGLRHWIDSAAELIPAVRRAIILGLAWAALGTELALHQNRPFKWPSNPDPPD